jgi:hypothetical protein
MGMQSFLGQWLFRFIMFGIHEAGQLDNAIQSLFKIQMQRCAFVDCPLVTLPETSHFNPFQFLAKIGFSTHGCKKLYIKVFLVSVSGLVMV